MLAGNLGELSLAHCTLVPGSSSLEIKTVDQAGRGNENLMVGLDHSICGPLALPDTIRSVRIADSIVDGALSVPALEIQASTVLGAINAGSLEASNSIFDGTVSVTRRQAGCVRFCFLPFDSQTPRRYRCQPADAVSAEQIFPTFASTSYGEPAYGQLAGTVDPAIGTGAEDEGEMGAFHFLQAPQRLKNLRVSLDEYLRFGLEAGIFFAS